MVAKTHIPLYLRCSSADSVRICFFWGLGCAKIRTAGTIWQPSVGSRLIPQDPCWCRPHPLKKKKLPAFSRHPAKTFEQSQIWIDPKKPHQHNLHSFSAVEIYHQKTRPSNLSLFYGGCEGQPASFNDFFKIPSQNALVFPFHPPKERTQKLLEGHLPEVKIMEN